MERLLFYIPLWLIISLFYFYFDVKTIWVYKLDGYVIGALELCKDIEVLELPKLNFWGFTY
jgi:hypothetical protein